MTHQEFRKHAHEVVDWMADYWENIEQYPVKSQVQPKEIYRQLPDNAPLEGESFERIFEDFQQLILQGVTHWQHPHFHAYFPANTSAPSVLAEMLTATMGLQCMVWQTSPSAAELEQKMMEWLREMCGLAEDWEGCIQDTASTATLCAILSARERATNYQINQKGFENQKFTVYCSTETHSSIDKAVKIAGLGINNLRKIPADENFSINASELEKTIKNDIALGYTPLCMIANIGTTSSVAVDKIIPLSEICKKWDIWLHVDAAFAGAAMILPEKRIMFTGIDLADSLVFNAHKWLFTNFDCSLYFVKDKGTLIRTFEIMPEYLKTGIDAEVNNYRDWGIPLGRRFRALKLWFVIRTYGLRGLQEKIRLHLELTYLFAHKISQFRTVEILAPLSFNLVCFRFVPNPNDSLESINQWNEQFLQRLNDTGKVFLTHTKLNGKYAIRAVFGQTNLEERHVEELLEMIRELSNGE
ncbi:MAG: pyridoxal phosphate-dependent decarboxylase family protein [Bacteroidia bacterium]